MKKSKKKVLLCDDSEIILFMVTNVIKRFSDDIEIITAENGLIGYEKFLQNEIDFVVTDIEMPQMNGWELIEKLGERNFDKKRIAVISATLEIKIAPKAKQYDILKYYIKPIMSNDILEMVNIIQNLEDNIVFQ